MKAVIFATALMLAHPAAAKTWVDETCQVMMGSTEKAFTIERTDGSHATKCDFDTWPIKKAAAKLTCDDGSSPEIEPLQDGSMRLDGLMLLPKGDKRVICD